MIEINLKVLIKRFEFKDGRIKSKFWDVVVRIGRCIGETSSPPAGCVSVDAVLTPQLRDPTTLTRRPLHKSTQPQPQQSGRNQPGMFTASILQVSQFGRFISQNKQDLMPVANLVPSHGASATSWSVGSPGFNLFFASAAKPGLLPLNSLQTVFSSAPCLV